MSSMNELKKMMELLESIAKRQVRVETRLAVLMTTAGAPIGRPTTQPTNPKEQSK